MYTKISLKFYIFCITIFFTIIFCSNANAIDDQELIINSLANRYGITRNEAMSVLFVAESEKAAKLCKFKLTKTFQTAKNAIVSNPRYKAPYDFIFKIPNDNNLNVKRYCQEWYNIAGPKQNNAYFQ